MVKKGWGVVFLVFIPLVKKTMLRPWCSIDSSGKKCHILDMRYVNMQLYKDKIKFDDWKCFENYLLANKGYPFKFDLKNGYHHIDIFNSHQIYLGFSWDIKGATKYFVFNVLPFGLSSEQFVFTKVVRHLVKHWRLHAVKIVCSLDDGLGIAYTYQDALSCSNFIKTNKFRLCAKRNKMNLGSSSTYYMASHWNRQ